MSTDPDRRYHAYRLALSGQAYFIVETKRVPDRWDDETRPAVWNLRASAAKWRRSQPDSNRIIIAECPLPPRDCTVCKRAHEQEQQ